MKKTINKVVDFVIKKTSKIFFAISCFMLFLFVVSLVWNMVLPNKSAQDLILSSVLLGFVFSMFGLGLSIEEDLDEVLNKNKY